MADRNSENQRPDERAVYVISVVAELTGTHPQTLRQYERKGLLEPQRTAGNSRRYSERDVEELRRIQELTQDEGVNLAGVRMVLDLEREMEKLRTRLQRAEQRLAQAQRKLAQAERKLQANGRRGVLVRLSDVRNIFDSR